VNGAGLTTDRNATTDNAYQFDRSAAQTIDVPASSTLNACPNMSLSLWTRLSSYAANGEAGYNHFVNKSPGGNNYQYVLANNSTGLYFYYGNGSAAFTTNTLPTLNAWQHVALTYAYDGTPANSWCRLYVDGTCTDSFPTSSVLQNTNHPLRFGSFPGGTYNTVDGKLDDIGIWNRALTPAEIQALYTSQPLTPCISPDPVSFTGLGTSYTTSAGPVTLAGTPASGVFIGPGVTGSTFSPAVAGEGTHSISYTYLDGDNCVNTSSLCTSVSLGMGLEPGGNAPGGVRVFPNPNRGQFTVELELAGLVGLQVFDARGALVQNEVFTASGSRTQRTLDLSAFAKGSYTLLVEHDGQRVSQAVVVE
jgi:hypothetical protein